MNKPVKLAYDEQSSISDLVAVTHETALMPLNYAAAQSKYQRDFFFPLAKSMQNFWTVESGKILQEDPVQSYFDYLALMRLNVELYHYVLLSSAETLLDYHLSRIDGDCEFEKAVKHLKHESDLLRTLAHDFPQQILEIADEYGFHFERGGGIKVSETERFDLYQVLPNEKGVEVRKDGKPVLIVHPYVLGSDILCFLPGEKKSYVHCFANQGIPTYVRIIKDIRSHEAVAKITLEDDILDMQKFCEIIRSRHGKPLTLNGYCQGGLITTSNIVSGKLDGLVDAHITCVAPIDGTRSEGLGGFLRRLPKRFNDLDYGLKRLPNGIVVGDGDLMSWVYKLKSIREEYPMIAFYRDLAMFDHYEKKGVKPSKTVLALNYWLFHQRIDLPLEITKLSHASYNIPVTKDGTLPFRAFDQHLNLRRMAEKNIRMLICYGESDSLVEKPCALAPLDYIDAEIAPFPKGHVAIATSWSLPTSEYPLDARFGDGYRGPVRFHLDLEHEQSRPQKKASRS